MNAAAPKQSKIEANPEVKIETKAVPSVLELGTAPNHGAEPPKPAQDFNAYKKSSLAASYWGGIEHSAEPLRHVDAKEAQETFLNGLLATPTENVEKDPRKLIISVVAHVAILGAVLIAPLLFTQAIDMSKLQTTFLLPKPPSAPPPPPPAIQQVARVIQHLKSAVMLAPTVIPKKIAEIKDAEAPDINPGGVVGGDPNGAIGGVLGGITGGPAMPAPPPSAKKMVYRVGGNVKAPKELSRVEPAYPVIAKTAHIQGTVVVSATIDENGNVVQARAVSGPAMLMASAVQAVLKWKYEPSYLNGEPVPVSMEVQVNFQLR